MNTTSPYEALRKNKYVVETKSKPRHIYGLYATEDEARRICWSGTTAAIILALTLALCGCEGNGIKRTEANDRAKPNVGGRFLCDNDLYDYETVVDSRTGVTYLLWKSKPDNNATDTRIGGITVLLNRDGTPVISEEVGE